MGSEGGGRNLRARHLAEQARTMRGVLTAGVVLLAMITVLGALAGTISLRIGLLVYGPGLAIHLGHLAALRRTRRTRLVAISFCVMYVVWVTGILVLRVGGLRPQAGMVFPPIVLLAGLIWSGSAAVGMAVVCSLISAGLVLLERQGVLSGGAPITPLHLWLIVTTCVVISAVILRYALGIIGRSTADAVRSEQRVADLVRAAPDAMLFAAHDHVVRACNPAAEKLFGWREADLVGRPLDDLVSADEDQQRVLAAHLATASLGRIPPPVEVIVRRQDGGDVPVEVRACRVAHTPADGGELHLTVRDLRDRTRAAVERRRLEDQLRQAQRLEALGRLAGGVAHDFNNLLTVILGSTDLIQLGTPAAAGHLREIEKAARSAADLTRQLLAFGRRQLLSAETVDVNRAVDGMRGILRRLLPENIALAVELAAAPALVSVDRVQLEQVILNLVMNARDAVAGGGTVTVRVALERPEPPAAEDDLPAHAVWLVVGDDGAGMTEEVMAHAFEPFYTTKGASKGSGLGLATVHGIVTQSGGHIYLESAAGRGTMVSVVFPRAGEEAQRRLGGDQPHREGTREIDVRSSSQ